MVLLNNFMALALESAPWLFVGLILGGLLKSFLPTQFMEKHLSKPGVKSIFKAALLGAPLPLCSCGVVPAAVGIRKAGASKSSTVSFLVSTPETGIDSLSISYALLGPIMMIARFISALMSAIVTGLMVLFLVERQELASNQVAESSSINEIDESCPHCASEAIESKTAVEPEKSCCSTQADNHTCNNSLPTAPSVWTKIADSYQYAMFDIYKDIVLWLVVGLVFAALVQTFVPSSFMAQWGHGLTGMLLFLIIGIPMYICATASTPVAAGLMLAGVSPGAALVFLLAGPATNIGTLGIVRNLLGTKTLWVYLISMGVVTLASGLILDAILQAYHIQINLVSVMKETGMPIVLQQISFLILAYYAIKIVWKKYGPTKKSTCSCG